MSGETIHLQSDLEISAFFQQTTGMIPGYRQLSRGPADLRYRIIDLDGVILLWGENRVHSLWIDQMDAASGFQFGFAIQADDDVVVRGHKAGPDHALIWLPGHEMEAVTKGRTATLEIGVSAEIVDELGWRFEGQVFSRVPSGKLQRLAKICRAMSASKAGVQTRRELVLDALEDAISPWTDPSLFAANSAVGDAPHRALVAAADHLLDRIHDQVHDAQEIADELGVSRRTLFYAFRKSLGIGPRRYFEVQRLYRLRQCLSEERRGKTVTEHATELGFGDLGRLARVYHEQFGELPSATLARACT